MQLCFYFSNCDLIFNIQQFLPLNDILQISDPDTSQRSPQGHVCTANPSKPFRISGVNLVVSEGSLNYELKSSYRVTVTCTDTGVPPLSLSKDFIIKVQGKSFCHFCKHLQLSFVFLVSMHVMLVKQR